MTKAKPKRRLKMSTIFRLYQRFSPYIVAQRGALMTAAVCMFIAAAMEIARPWPIKLIFDAILIPRSNPDGMTAFAQRLAGSDEILLALCALMIILVALVGGFFTYVQTVLLATVGRKVVAGARYDLYRHIQQLSQTFHESASTGDLLARLTGDVRNVRELLVTSVVQSSGRALVVVGTVAVMFAMDWRLTLVAITVLPVLVWATISFSGQIKSAARNQRKKEGNVANVMAENLTAIKVIQAYARESHESERFQKENTASATAELRAARLEAYMARLVQIILGVGTAVVVWYGVTRVKSGSLTPGDLLVFTAYLSGLYKPIRRLASMTSRAAKAAACGERLLAILDLKPEIADAPTAIQPWQFSGRVELRDVTFGYSPQQPILRGASFRIHAGERVAFLSRSGSGKTTIAQLILRLYDPQAGEVLIDGRNIRDFKLVGLRDQIAFLPQDTALFNASIRDNIAYGKLDASDDEIVAAAHAANAHEFIMSMVDGYDTVIGERGATLSGGQRQRIAIARAMIREAAIVILDEPATGLDAENEAVVVAAIDRLVAGRTCIVITHDKATAAMADRVFEIRDGQVVEIPKPVAALAHISQLDRVGA